MNVLNDILRLNIEPYRVWVDGQIHDILTKEPNEFMIHMNDELRMVTHDESVCPPKKIFTDKKYKGDFRVMPCVTGTGFDALKTVKIVGTNHQQQVIKDQITVGKAFAIHPTDNYITDIFDACVLSSARTGMLAALAAWHLDAKTDDVAIVGAGRVGFYAAFYMCSLFEIKKMRIIDIDPKRSETMVNYLRTQFPEIEFVIHLSLSLSDTIIVATNSTTPIINPFQTCASTVISVGADEVGLRELHVDWIYEANIYVESIDSERYGDLFHWKMFGHRFEYYTIDELLFKGKVQNDKKRSVFITTGSALYDNFTIGYILKKHGSR